MSNASEFVIEADVLKEYVGAEDTIVIPEGITEIERHACSFNKKLRKVIIPEGVRVIGDHAFCHCAQLAEVTIPTSVEIVGDSAFSHTKLKKITIHAGNLLIKQQCFGFLPPVQELVIDGDSVELKGFAFDRTKINSMNLSVAKIKSSPNAFDPATIAALVESGKVHPKIVTKDLMIKAVCAVAAAYASDPSGVGYWEAWKAYFKRNVSGMAALAGENTEFLHMITAEKMLLPKAAQQWLDAGTLSSAASAVVLEYLGQTGATTQGAKRIETLSIKPPSLSQLKKIWDFEELEDGGICLTSYKGADTVVVVPEYIGKKPVTHLRKTFTASFMGTKANQRENRRKITEVILPEGLLSIGEDTFYECGALAQVTIPAQTRTIGARAFQGCGKIVAIDLPDSVTELGENAFSGMRNLKEVKLSAGITSLPNRVFSWCEKLEKVSGMEHIATVETGAFSKCDGLTDANGVFVCGKALYWVHSSRKEVQIPLEVETVDPAVYQGRETVCFADHVQCSVTMDDVEGYARHCKELHFPKTITQIPDATAQNSDYYGVYYTGVFSKNTNLEKVVFPEGFTAIGSFAFYKAEKLETVELPVSLVRLGAHAFEKTLLKSVTIPGNVAVIEENVFDGCGVLGAAFLGEGVQQIQKEAFARCKEMKAIHIPGSVTDISPEAFTSKKKLTIYAPTGSYAEAYAKENNIPFVAE